MNYTVKNIDFDRSTASGNMVEYHWYSNNVTVKDDWDNIEKNYPVEVRREFDATNVWMWRIPYGKAGVKDESEAAVKVGTYSTYTVTFEFIDPDTNKVISKGKLTDVGVEMGKNKNEATSSISTGDAELTQ